MEDVQLWIFAIALSPVWLWLAYIPAIQYKRGGFWRLMYPVTLIVALADIALNYTVLAFYTWDWPRKGELTFSKRLDRLILLDGWVGVVCRYIAFHLLDPIDPSGRHV